MAMRLVKGNAAVVIGALYAGCDCYFGYPITPASEVLQEASEYFPRAGRRFVQAESEVAAINMVYGAASTGRRVMTASSGPGISLKQEGVSYLAGSELPAVIVDVVRAGPGLGNIGPEQGDYFQVVKGGGHGNYRCIVLAPDSVQEMCDCVTGRQSMCWPTGCWDRCMNPCNSRKRRLRPLLTRAGRWPEQLRRVPIAFPPLCWTLIRWRRSTSVCRKNTP